VTTSTLPTERTAASIFFSGTTYFVHFLALGFSSFPLQTHLRKVLTPSSASLVASIAPIAACITYFFFRYAESRGWTKSPRLVLFCTSVGVALLQLLLGWRMQQTTAGNVLLGPVIDIAMCILLLGCVQSSTMTLLNHIGVSTMGDHAYSVRAAGSAGYMVALLLMGSVGSSAETIADYHMFIGATVSVCHAIFAFLAWWLLPTSQDSSEVVLASASVATSSAPKRKTAQRTDRWEWFGLLLLVWMVAICEMSYGLYAHEFLTTTYGNYGYFVFAGAVAIEIGVLMAMPFLPSLKRQLLFVGPLGWVLLFTGCLMATQGFGAFGLFAMALALNCPFQISTNEHAHRMNPSVMGVASMTLAQSIGYTTATVIASLASRFGVGPAPLWVVALPLAMLALMVAIRKLARKDAAFDIDNLGEPSCVSRSRTVSCAEKRPDDFKGGFGADHACTDAEDIHVIVLDALASGVSVVAETGANSGKLVRRHANANS
jgi:hypothetical protein